MKALEELQQNCPHCYEPNPVFKQQRCQHCGLPRMSDAEWKQLLSMKPRLSELGTAVEQLRDAEHPLPAYARLQPMLVHLAPLRSQEPWLATHLDEIEEGLILYEQAFEKARMQLKIHLFILFILLLVPVMSVLMGAVWWLSTLLTLPVIGWAYLGVWKFAKSVNG
ncbi:MAG: hypothetical protein AAF399_10625 [Bacteroidota bacterium]